MKETQVGRPIMPPGYGVQAAEEGGLLPWAWVDERLSAARNYWLCTARADGRPHAMPVWGVWLDGAVMFGTDRASRKGQNLATKPDCVVHLESGDEVVILEGRAEEIRDRETLGALADAYEVKYAIRAIGEEPGAGAAVYAVRPKVVLAWLEADFPKTATRWRLGVRGA
jgi:pyridoxine/pyridoxamine 5'-phosphate oxidase